MSDQNEYTLDPQRWVDRYGDYLFNYAIVRVSDREKAEDLVQETFLSALKARESYRGDSTERTWLTSILKRKIIDTYRKKYSSRESAMGESEGIVFDGDYYRGEDPFGGHWQEGKGPHSHSLLPEGKLAIGAAACYRHTHPARLSSQAPPCRHCRRKWRPGRDIW